MKKECPICGKQLETDKIAQKYCSDDCRKKGRKIVFKKWCEDKIKK